MSTIESTSNSVDFIVTLSDGKDNISTSAKPSDGQTFSPGHIFSHNGITFVMQADGHLEHINVGNVLRIQNAIEAIILYQDVKAGTSSVDYYVDIELPSVKSSPTTLYRPSRIFTLDDNTSLVIKDSNGLVDNDGNVNGKLDVAKQVINDYLTERDAEQAGDNTTRLELKRDMLALDGDIDTFFRSHVRNVAIKLFNYNDSKAEYRHQLSFTSKKKFTDICIDICGKGINLKTLNTYLFPVYRLTQIFAFAYVPFTANDDNKSGSRHIETGSKVAKKLGTAINRLYQCDANGKRGIVENLSSAIRAIDKKHDTTDKYSTFWLESKHDNGNVDVDGTMKRRQTFIGEILADITSLNYAGDNGFAVKRLNSKTEAEKQPTSTDSDVKSANDERDKAKAELASLQTEFDAAAQRGNELASEIDTLRARQQADTASYKVLKDALAIAMGALQSSKSKTCQNAISQIASMKLDIS